MIEVDQLGYVHAGGRTALQGLDVTLHGATWTAIIGANGSGKTTLARCLNGLNLPTSGSVRVDGVPLNAQTLVEIRRRVGMVFQNPDDQLVAPTVETDIAFGLENHGVDPVEMRARVDEVLGQFQLSAYRNHPPHLLSGGERQRLAVASAVAVRPAYLVLDEPTALLDPPSRAELMHIVADLVAQGLGVVQITQSPEEAAHADRVLVLHEGRLVDDGSPQQVFSRPGQLAAIGLRVPFAVQVAKVAGVGAGAGAGDGAHDGDDAGDVLHTGDLAPWLVRTFLPPDLPAPSEAAEAAAQPVRVHTQDVSHVYRAGVPEPIHALREVSVDLAAGTITALIGASGSGKTTLVQHFNGLLRPTGGVVQLDGTDIWARGDSRQARRQVGLVFQFPEAQLFEETVAADVAFGPRNHGASQEHAAQQAATAMEAVGLPMAEFGSRDPTTLSGGEKRRAAIAGVLAFAPSVLVLDEPTAGLDPANEQLVAELLVRLAADGCSVVLVSHDMDRVAELATTTIVLHQGRVRWSGPTRQTLLTACASDRASGEAAAVEPPAALRLTLELREHGWHVPAMLTRQEVCRFVEGLRRRDT